MKYTSALQVDQLDSVDATEFDLTSLISSQDMRDQQLRDFNAICAQLLDDAQRDLEQHKRWYAAGLVTLAELASARRRLIAQRQNIQLVRGGKNAHKKLDAIHCAQLLRVVKMV